MGGNGIAYGGAGIAYGGPDIAYGGPDIAYGGTWSFCCVPFLSVSFAFDFALWTAIRCDILVRGAGEARQTQRHRDTETLRERPTHRHRHSDTGKTEQYWRSVLCARMHARYGTLASRACHTPRAVVSSDANL
eukprot:1966649-Rhodomonas_salina.4